MTRSARRAERPWAVLLLGCAIAIAALEIVFLELYFHFLSGRFPSTDFLPNGWAAARFLAGALLLNVSLILGLWTLSAPLLRRLLLSPLQRFASALLLALGVPFAYDGIRWPLRSYLGDALDLELFLNLAGGHVLELVRQAGAFVWPLLAVIAVGLVAGVALVARLRRVSSRLDLLGPAPGAARLALAFGGAVVASSALLGTVCRGENAVCFGLARTTAGVIHLALLARLTDVDLDGFGIASWPRDPAPLDSAIYPYALDAPGNGIDENGLAGDHPVGNEWREPVSDAPPRWTRRPHVLLVFLEGYRDDVLDAELDGRRVAPVLAGLAAQGTRSRRTYANSPFTARSRAQLLGGRVHPYPGQRTLVHDFLANGYRVAWFSGQHDGFGDSEPLLGCLEADPFYDARQDVERRYTESASRASLGVSWKVLNERLLAFLHGVDPARPLFLYVNYYDTHYPYHHAEIDDLLGVEPLPAAEIRPGTRERLWRTYLNTAANVDQALGQLLTAWRAALGTDDYVVIVTADHAEALFDEGYLGHGQSLRAEQSRVPFVLRGIGGDWPEPLGLSEVRGLVQRNLDLAPSRARLVPDPQRGVLQYLGKLRSPRWIGLRRADDALVYGFGTGRTEQLDAAERSLPHDVPVAPELWQALIWRWESLVAAEERAGRLSAR